MQPQEIDFKPWEATMDAATGMLVKAKEAVVGAGDTVKQAWGPGMPPPEVVRMPPAKEPPAQKEHKFETVFSNLINEESKGKHTDATGALTTSGVGAQGITQLMAKTAKKPGYGVEPVKDTSEKEYLRFGRDYLKAMLKEFGGDYRKAVAAYNAGPGSIKKAVARGGDKWEDHLPKPSETKPYMTKILGE